MMAPVNWRDWLFSNRFDIDRLDNRDEALIQRFVGVAEAVRRYHRAEVRGVERVPAGPALYVGNHNAGIWTPDSWIFTAAVYREHGLDAVPFGLGHELAIRLRPFHELVVRLGAVRASHENAHRLFAAGRKVLVYPGGDEDSMRPFRDRHRIVFGGRTGFVRLALEAGVPIVPIVACGAHSAFLVLSDNKWLARAIGVDRALRLKVWPTVLSIPWGLTLGPTPPFIPFPSRILIEIMPPIRFREAGPEAAADRDLVARHAADVADAMQDTLDRLARERRQQRRG